MTTFELIKSQQDAFGSSQWDFPTREKTASFEENDSLLQGFHSTG